MHRHYHSVKRVDEVTHQGIITMQTSNKVMDSYQGLRFAHGFLANAALAIVFNLAFLSVIKL